MSAYRRCDGATGLYKNLAEALMTQRVFGGTLAHRNNQFGGGGGGGQGRLLDWRFCKN